MPSFLHGRRGDARHESSIALDVGQVADAVDIVVAGNGQLGLDHDATGPVERHSQRLRQRRGGNARGPDDGMRMNPLGSDPDPFGVDPRDLHAGPDGHAELLELPPGRVSQIFGDKHPERRGLASTRITRAEAVLMWRKSRARVCRADLGERAGQLDSGRAGADDHEGHPGAAVGASSVSRSATSNAIKTRCRMRKASFSDLRPGACTAQSSWPK